MHRKVLSAPLGDGTRWRTVITDIPSSGADIKTRQFEFLRELVNDGVYSGLLLCGPVPFATMKMYHNGAWVVELESFEPKPDKGD